MSLHLKRLASPRAWLIPKKKHTWVPKPLPGPHAKSGSIPVVIALRDYLGVCRTSAEAKRIVANRDLLIDGKPARSIKQVVGFMDVLTLKSSGDSYRVFYDRHGRIFLHEVDQKTADWKLARVRNKTTVRGGITQVNLHDGRNILVKEAGEYKTGDTVRVHVPDQKVMGHYPFAEGSYAVVTGGAHIGEVARVKSVHVVRSPQPNRVVLERSNGDEFNTITDYVFVIGKDKAEISLPSEGGAA